MHFMGVACIQVIGQTISVSGGGEQRNYLPFSLVAVLVNKQKDG